LAGGPAALKDREVCHKDPRPTGADHSSRAVARIGLRPCRPQGSCSLSQRSATNGSRPFQPSGSSYWLAALPPDAGSDISRLMSQRAPVRCDRSECRVHDKLAVRDRQLQLDPWGGRQQRGKPRGASRFADSRRIHYGV
jgi:hypothetical protein